MTNFIHHKIEAEGMEFYVDGNSKITASNGTFEEPKPNAFSLMHIEDCPGATPSCKEACYVHGLKKYAPDVFASYEINSRNIRAVIAYHEPDSEKFQNVVKAFAKWIGENCKEFRWHVSGDLLSASHAIFIAHVCRECPTVLHWIYTRTFDKVVMDIITRVDNLIVNISADKDNLDEAIHVGETYNLRICYFTNDGTFPDHPNVEVIFPDYKFRGRELPTPADHEWWKGLALSDKKKVCPVDFFGQSETNRCGKCTKCMKPLGRGKE